MIKYIFIFFTTISTGLLAQTTTPDLLVNIQKASQTEIDAYNTADLEIGMLVYNTDENRIYKYTDAGFLQIFTEADQTITVIDIAAGELTYANEDDSNANVNLISADASNSITAGTDGALFVDVANEETVTGLEQDDTTGEITYTDENDNDATAQIIGVEADNQITVGANGGAYLGPTVYSGFFIIDNTTLTSTGTYAQLISGFPFQPSQVTFVAHPNIGSFDLNEDNALPDTPNANIDNNTALLENTFGTMNGFARAGTPINQAVIFSGGSGSSINNISRYSNDQQCIGIRYTNNNGNNLGIISAVLSSFNTNGFNLNITYTLGTTGNAAQQDDILDESLIVLFTAYK